MDADGLTFVCAMTVEERIARRLGRTAIVGLGQTSFEKGLPDTELSLACQAISLARGRLVRLTLLPQAYCWLRATPFCALACDTWPTSSPQSVV